MAKSLRTLVGTWVLLANAGGSTQSLRVQLPPLAREKFLAGTILTRRLIVAGLGSPSIRMFTSRPKQLLALVVVANAGRNYITRIRVVRAIVR